MPNPCRCGKAKVHGTNYCRSCLDGRQWLLQNPDLALEDLYTAGHIILPPPFVKLDADAMLKAYLESLGGK